MFLAYQILHEGAEPNQRFTNSLKKRKLVMICKKSVAVATVMYAFVSPLGPNIIKIVRFLAAQIVYNGIDPN